MKTLKGIPYWAFVLLLVWLVPLNRLSATGFTLNLVTEGSGTLSANPTNSVYPSGVEVAISASPAVGWYFSGWSGATNTLANPVNVTMTGNLIVTGTFLPFPTYSITLTTNGQGAIALSPSDNSYYSNSLVNATATPAAGWVFAGWSGDASGNLDPLPLTVDNNLNLTGTFAELPYFDLEPPGVTNVAGTPISLNSHVTGTGPLNYQWFFAGNLDAGATSPALSFTHAQTTNSGQYWLVASSPYGSVTSSVVSILITNATGSTNLISVCDETGLRAAVAIGGWITIGCNGTITLSNPIDITNNVILDGENVSTVISGGRLTRLFNVWPSGSLSITNVTLANGGIVLTNGSPTTNADGGAIYNNGGTVNLFSCILSNNSAQALINNGIARGGAIFNLGGQVFVSDSLATSNFLVSSLGIISGVYSTSDAEATCLGGAFYNEGGNMALAGDSILNNRLNANISNGNIGPVGGVGLGGAIYNTNGSLVLLECVVSNNLCSAQSGYFSPQCSGGAIFQNSGFLAITNSLVIANSAVGGGGSGSLAYPYSPLSAYGGGIAALSGSVALDHVKVNDNIAASGGPGYHTSSEPAYGGGIYNQANMAIEYCTLNGNVAVVGSGNAYFSSSANGDGGAIYNLGGIIIDRCCVYSNQVQGSFAQQYAFTPGNGGNSYGGGIFNAGQFAATNSTIVCNLAVSGSGSIPSGNSTGTNGEAFGGGVYNDVGGMFSAWNITVAANSVIAISNAQYGVKGLTGQAAGAQVYNSGSTLSLHNSILAYSDTNGNAYGTITDLGYNISSDASASFNSGSSYNNTDPLLGPLADNGGPTLTMALLPNSPCIDFGDSNNAPITDQRGYSRPAGGGYDIGAFEFDAAPPGAGLWLNLLNANTNKMVSLSFNASSGKTFIIQTSTDLKTWTPWLTNGPFVDQTIITQPINTTNSGNHYFRVLEQ